MSAPPFAYRAFGLTIRSDLTLPELVPGDGAIGADACFRLGAIDADEIPAGDTAVRHLPDGVLLAYPVGHFLVRAGREVVIALAPGADERDARLGLLGPALAVLLHQRGLLVLHGSAAIVGGAAVGFLGFAGAGKSTLAAALHAAGYPPLADDLVVVDLAADPPRVLPGFPQFKLWPEAVAALGGDPDALPVLGTTVVKRARRLAEPFATGPLPLRRLYVLAEGEAVALEPLAGQEALVDLVRHSFCAGLVPATGPAGHFRQCAALLRALRPRRLVRPKSFDTLGDTVAVVARDAGDGD